MRRLSSILDHPLRPGEEIYAMKSFPKYALVAAMLMAFALPSFAARKSTVRIVNQSKWAIHHVFLSSSEAEEWGPDQLEDSILGKGDSITITDVPCDTYDVKVVDEDGDECIVEKVDLCGENSYWKITDKDLLECEGYR
jgi:hypothetical protein